MRCSGRSRSALALILALSGSACASGSQGFDRTDESVIRRVAVTNDNQSDVIVFAFVGPTRYRLGMATAKTSQEYQIPDAANLVSQDVVIRLQMFGSGARLDLGPVVPANGTVIQVVIAPNFATSRVLIL